MGVVAPDEFVEVLDEWREKGGTTLERIPTDHKVTTLDEVHGLCRALSSPHIYVVNSIKTPALYYLLAFFHYTESIAAIDVLRVEGLPLLRRIVSAELDNPQIDNADDWAVRERVSAHLFAIYILVVHRQANEVPLIVRACRDTVMSNNFFWSNIFNTVAENHPAAVEICEILQDPLPEGLAGVAYLDLAKCLGARSPNSATSLRYRTRC